MMAWAGLCQTLLVGVLLVATSAAKCVYALPLTSATSPASLRGRLTTTTFAFNPLALGLLPEWLTASLLFGLAVPARPSMEDIYGPAARGWSKKIKWR